MLQRRNFKISRLIEKKEKKIFFVQKKLKEKKDYLWIFFSVVVVVVKPLKSAAIKKKTKVERKTVRLEFSLEIPNQYSLFCSFFSFLNIFFSVVGTGTV